MTASAAFPTLVSLAQAQRLVAEVAATRPMPVEHLSLSRADGRVLAQDVVAPLPLPCFDNSAMDGFAVRHQDLAGSGPHRLALVGEQFAGHDAGRTLGPGQCVRITTGAVLPAGADAVVAREQASEAEGGVQLAGPVAAGQYVRRQGEDVARGQTVLEAGQVLGPAKIGLAAALGLDRLAVYARPTVAVLTSGDELVEPGLPLAPGQIYNSNREQLMAQVRALGLEPVAWPNLPDDPARLATVLGDAVESFDVVLACGGVSAGEKDYLPGWLQAHGQVHFWKVRMRPGMPVLFGEAGRARVLGLPGNPVSVLASFHVLGRLLLDALQQRRTPRRQWQARLLTPWSKTHARVELLRGHLGQAEDGCLTVAPDPANGSHRLRAAAGSDVLVVLEEGERDYAAGELVSVLPL
jgi:molybdopterin molybdotransferase